MGDFEFAVKEIKLFELIRVLWKQNNSLKKWFVTTLASIIDSRMADSNFEVGPSCCDKIDKIRYSDKYLKKKRQYTHFNHVITYTNTHVVN